jgi:hypothetical protein
MSNGQHGPLSIVSNTAATASATYLAVAIAAAGLTLPAAGGAIIGVTQTKGALGKPVKVECRPGERTPATSGGAVAFGDKLKVDAAGKFILASAQDIADGKCVAWCYDGAAAANRKISVVLLGSAGMPTLSPIETIADDVDHVVATSAYTEETLVTLATTNMTGALANGLYVGQLKTITVDSQAAAFTYALTPTTMKAGQPASFTFTAKGQQVKLRWTATGWEVIAVRTAGTGTTANAGTINPLIARQGLIIGSAGAEARTLPNGYVPGHRIKIAADTVGTGTTTVAATMINANGTAGTAATYNAALDEAVWVWTGAAWMLESVISVTSA